MGGVDGVGGVIVMRVEVMCVVKVWVWEDPDSGILA